VNHCLGQRSFCSNVIVRKHTHTDPTECSVWTIKVAGNTSSYNNNNNRDDNFGTVIMASHCDSYPVHLMNAD